MAGVTTTSSTLNQVDPNHVAEQVRLVQEILAMMVGIEATPVACCWPPREDVLAASLEFSGGWRGTMTLEGTLPFACAFAARLMSIPLPEGSNEDVRDALAELANMIAGNFKTLLPPACQLSVPVVELHGSTRVPPRSGEWNELQFQTDCGSCCVLLKAH